MLNRTKLNIAVQYLRNSGVIASPTDTIYGLIALPNKPYAIEKILQLKKRPSTKGLILLSSDIAFALPFIEDKLTKQQLTKISTPQQTPTTYLFSASNIVPYYIKGSFDTIAIRITNNEIIKHLCIKSNSALVSSSANISTKPCAKDMLKLRVYFGNNIDYALHPKITKNTNKASIIKDFFSNKQYR